MVGYGVGCTVVGGGDAELSAPGGCVKAADGTACGCVKSKVAGVECGRLPCPDCPECVDDGNFLDNERFFCGLGHCYVVLFC